MPTIDRNTFQGLVTDEVLDQGESAALRLMNVIPASDKSVSPRAPVQLVTHYRPVHIGRPIIVDGLPGDLGNGILVTTLVVEDDGSGTRAVTQTIKTLDAFRPAKIAADYDNVIGFPVSSSFFGIII